MITSAQRFRLLNYLKATFLSGLFTMFAATGASAQTINTIPSWNGTSFISSFGVVNTATYGQTITVGAGATALNSFSFEIGNCSANVTFRGHVYAWNGTQATGASLWDGAPQTLSSSASYTLVTFNVGSVMLPAGQYVLFVSTSEDQSAAPASACRFGALTNDTTYGGGQFVFINNGPNPAQWTANPWSFIAEDLAFQVVGLVTAPVPTLSEWSMIILSSLLAMFGIAIYMRRRKG